MIFIKCDNCKSQIQIKEFYYNNDKCPNCGKKRSKKEVKKQSNDKKIIFIKNNN